MHPTAWPRPSASGCEASGRHWAGKVCGHRSTAHLHRQVSEIGPKAPPLACCSGRPRHQDRKRRRLQEVLREVVHLERPAGAAWKSQRTLQSTYFIPSNTRKLFKGRDAKTTPNHLNALTNRKFRPPSCSPASARPKGQL